MTAASAAYILKRLVGSFENAGFFKFKDLLAQLEADGFLITGSNSKNAFSFHLTAPPAHAEGPVLRAHPRLRADVWYAFVKSEPSGKRFFNSETGQVRTQCETSPGEAWVEIPQIVADVEKQRAEKFIAENQLSLTGASEALARADWYIAFPELLKQESAQLATTWKRERSNAVVGAVEQWRQEHGIAETLVYEQRVPNARRTDFQSGMSSKPFQNTNPLRVALLNAIAKMPMEDLLQMPIPPSYLVNELGPDLLK